MLDIGNATVATAGSLTITRTLLHMDENFKSLPLILRLRNIARDFLSSISFDIYMLMLVFMFLHITIPQPIVTLITPFANANAFCAMAMIGLMMEIPDNRKDKVELGKVIAWRMAFGATIAVAAWFLLPFDMRIREIIVLGSFDRQCQARRLLINSDGRHQLGGDDRLARASTGSVRRVSESYARTITLRRSPIPSTCTMVSSPGSR